MQHVQVVVTPSASKLQLPTLSLEPTVPILGLKQGAAEPAAAGEGDGSNPSGQQQRVVRGGGFTVELLSPTELAVADEINGVGSIVRAPTHRWDRLHPLRKVLTVAVSSDGKMGASGSGDGTVRVWDATTGMLTRDLKDQQAVVWSKGSAEPDVKGGHAGDVLTVQFYPSNQVLLSGGLDATLKV